MISSKLLDIRFDKIDGFITVFDATRNLLLFGPEKYDAIFNRIRYLIGLESGITYVFLHNYARIKVYSYDFLPLEKILTLHNVIIHMRSVLNKDQNYYYNNTFLEKCFYQFAKN